jgi:hypothetical protein
VFGRHWRRLLKTNAETFGVELSNKSRVYQTLYPSYFDSVPYPTGWRTPDFVKFNWEDNRTTYLAQLGEVGFVDALKVHLFSLSLTDTISQYLTQLEHKFHDQFYNPGNELKLSDLTSVRQGRDESVNDYIRRFRDTKN